MSKEITYIVDTTPDASIGRKLSQSGHDFYEAIAELIDNSFDAHATDIAIDITNAKGAKYNITITDNGVGMNMDELTDAITLAKSSKSSEDGDLGLFGLGMKTSLGALGTIHKIETSTMGSTDRFLYRNDDKIPKKEHESKIGKRDDASRDSSYTIVKIGELKFQTPKRLALLKEKTAERYSKILDAGNTTLTINKTVIKPVVIKFIKDIPRIEGTITYNGGSYTYFLGYVAKNTGTYGINMYKNYRIIEEKKKDIMGLRGRHQHERGIYGEIFLNDFDTDHTKTQFLRTDQFLKFENAFKKDPQIRAWRRQVLQYNGSTREVTPVTKETQQKVEALLKKMSRYINKNNILDDFNFNSVEKSTHENSISKIVPDSSSSSSSAADGIENPKPTPQKEPIPRTKPPAASIKWQAGGVMFDIKPHVEDLNNIECIKEYALVNETTLNVIINNGGRVYNAYQSKTAFITQEIVQAFIECLIDKKGVPYSRAFELRENILNAAYL